MTWQVLRLCRGLAGFDTLDGLIRRDRRWLPPLLDFANYTPNPALQVEAVKIAAILVDRLPHFSDLLLQPASAGEPVRLPALAVPQGLAA